MLIILFFARIVVLLQPVYTYYNIMEANTSINPLVNCAMVYGTSMGLFWNYKHFVTGLDFVSTDFKTFEIKLSLGVN